MALVDAAYLGIYHFSTSQNKESWLNATESDTATLIRAVYQQVLGFQYVLKSDRLEGPESLFRRGYLSVRELVRQIAKSSLYRKRFFESTNPYRFIELNFKHLLGRAPQNKAEMREHFTILQEQGFDAEIDSYIDSAEYQERFGEDQVPYLHGWDYSTGQQVLQFTYLLHVSRGTANSLNGHPKRTNIRLGKALHQVRVLPVVSPIGAIAAFQSSKVVI
jgi:phycoerythrin-associated linker protein